jgi:hypothetical protein
MTLDRGRADPIESCSSFQPTPESISLSDVPIPRFEEGSRSALSHVPPNNINPTTRPGAAGRRIHH